MIENGVASEFEFSQMRNATPEERKSVSDYIDSISTSTGVIYNPSDLSDMISVECFICGESAELTKQETARINYGYGLSSPKICPKCREAWVKIRDLIVR